MPLRGLAPLRSEGRLLTARLAIPLLLIALLVTSLLLTSLLLTVLMLTLLLLARPVAIRRVPVRSLRGTRPPDIRLATRLLPRWRRPPRAPAVLLPRRTVPGRSGLALRLILPLPLQHAALASRSLPVCR
jgi:hypothetical protein